MTHAAPLPERVGVSPFRGRLVHELMGLDLEPAAKHPRFDDDIWDLTGVLDAPIQLRPQRLVWDFTAIPYLHWQVMVREFLVAIRAPQHDAVATLPWARRQRLSLQTCIDRRFDVFAWLRWLADEGVERLTQVTQEHCERYLRRREDDGLGPSSLKSVTLAIKDLARYGELFTTDRYPPAFMPWAGKSATMVAGYVKPGENVTSPVPDLVLRPALTAGLYLVEVLGPHVADLVDQSVRRRTKPVSGRRARRDEFAALMARYIEDRSALPELDDHDVRERLNTGWDQRDPLLRLNFSELARDLDVTQFRADEIHQVRDLAETAVAQVGVAPYWARTADLIERADNRGRVPWTTALTANRVNDLAMAVFNAALLTAVAVSGMRSGEVMELTTSSCLPPREFKPGLFRYCLASKRIKGEQWGGVADEWVVIEPAYRAVELATRLVTLKASLTPTSMGPDTSVFGRYDLVTRFDTLRRWVNSPAGARLGLEPIPQGRVTGRMLRRTLALELAHRPNGLWAAKVHLKQVAIATTEGYSARPGGAQARFHAEMVAEEHAHNIELTAAAYRDYRNGRLPAGPGAKNLIAAFQHVDTELAAEKTTQPTVVASDRHIELLLKKRAATLHVQPANFCWFTDPAKALCLKLAGAPTETQPLAGLCDAARCPQATFHAEHRKVWAGCAKTTEAFLCNPRIPVGEKTRLTTEHERAQRVVEAIDDATAPAEREGR
jgi:hypothetical protein